MIRPYILSIPRAHDRLANMLRQWPDAVVFPGVDYRDLQADWGGCDRIILPQAAIMAGHVRLWNHLLTATPDDAWLILEDDASLAPNGREMIDQALREIQYQEAWQILKLTCEAEPRAERTRLTEHVYQLRWNDYVGTAAYIATRPTLQDAVNHTCCAAVDFYLSRYRTLAVIPNPVKLLPCQSTYPAPYDVHQTNHPQLPLLPRDLWAPLEQSLAGKRVLFCRPLGNLGDELIRASEALLFSRWGVTVRTWYSESPIPPDAMQDVDLCVWGGGGNLGTAYQNALAARQAIFHRAHESGIPCLVLPSTVCGDPEPLPPGTKVFVRERRSQELYPESILVPDVALAFDGPIPQPAPLSKIGVFLRRHEEAANQDLAPLSRCDPAEQPHYTDYFRLAGTCETIVTDRLHFAIAALMLGRHVVLLPNSYWKNEAMHQAWLQDLGCQFGRDSFLAANSKA